MFYPIQTADRIEARAADKMYSLQITQVVNEMEKKNNAFPRIDSWHELEIQLGHEPCTTVH